MNWTEGRFRAFITSLLRGGFRKYPPKYETLKAAYLGKQENKKTGRQANHYKCAKCKKAFPSSDVEVDHISPVVSLEDGFINWDTFIERLFGDGKNLQVLCKSCHKDKTTKEKASRKK